MKLQSTIPDPLPPAFYPVSLNVVGRRCVVIGDDLEAIEKAEALREVGADVVVFPDHSTVQDADIIDAFFVLSTPQDAVFSQRLRALADQHRFLLCTIDQPLFGFVAMQAVVKAGPTRIGISTGGVAPRVGKKLRQALQAALDQTFERFVECLATQKLRNRRLLENDPSGRRKAMIQAAEGFEIDIQVRYPQWFTEREKNCNPRLQLEGAADAKR
jgi:siroheme synthase (precorrin-2 oxidase/ferrochelatase)